MQKVTLDARLLSAASLVTGDFIADVGTDHGFLPIYLLQIGKVKRAVASDIRPEPLSKARENIEKHGLSGAVETVLTDGLNGLDKYPLTDVVIAGMGGLTVIDILRGAAFLRDKKTHLIMQPVQHAPQLREYLGENGFFIDREALALDEGRVYEIISAVYDGKKRIMSGAELTLGAFNIAHKGEYAREFIALCDKTIRHLSARIEGLGVSGADAKDERELQKIIEKEKSLAEEIWQA